MTEEEIIVKELLIDFFEQRFNWEDSAYKEMQSLKESGREYLEIFKIFRPKLEKIYSHFLTEKERKQTLSFNRLGSEPYYDPNSENIDSITTKTKNRIIVHTTMDRNNSKQKNEYVFLKKSGNWKLDNKKTYWDFKKKWESTVL